MTVPRVNSRLMKNRCRPSRWALVLACIPFTSNGPRAQEVIPSGAEQKSMRVVRVAEAPTIDGVLDEAVWSQAAVIDDLHEIQPTEYAEPSERTVIYVIYDDDALYVGARLFDREPERITARISRQGEEVFGDDWFSVIIDPFNDRRSGYRFLTNPNGLRQEGLFQNVTDTQWEWQGIWYTAGSIDSDGWVTEIAIPFKSISFNPASDTWGINFRRAVARRDERMGWVSRNRNTDPSVSGLAVGFAGLQQGRGLDVVPSVSATREKERRSRLRRYRALAEQHGNRRRRQLRAPRGEFQSGTRVREPNRCRRLRRRDRLPAAARRGVRSLHPIRCRRRADRYDCDRRSRIGGDRFSARRAREPAR
jgi:hypothetical protein